MKTKSIAWVKLFEYMFSIFTLKLISLPIPVYTNHIRYFINSQEICC